MIHRIWIHCQSHHSTTSKSARAGSSCFSCHCHCQCHWRQNGKDPIFSTCSWPVLACFRAITGSQFWHRTRDTSAFPLLCAVRCGCWVWWVPIEWPELKGTWQWVEYPHWSRPVKKIGFAEEPKKINCTYSSVDSANAGLSKGDGKNNTSKSKKNTTQPRHPVAWSNVWRHIPHSWNTWEHRSVEQCAAMILDWRSNTSAYYMSKSLFDQV